jgi:D-3-phosphoglycerate dehydrogenase
LVPSVIQDDSIVVTSCSGLFANQVAEQTLALLLGLVRSAPVFFCAQQRHEFIRRPTGDLHGKTVGILGFGGNGRRLAEVLAAFRCRILATDMFPVNKPSHVEQLLPADQFRTVLSKSDVVILCVPLTDRTTGMIDAAALRAMPNHALLINVARGPIVREADLAVALEQGWIAGAALDVTEVEPLPAESPLWDMPNVIITPHVGAQSAHRVDDTTDLFCENLQRFQRGLTLINQVDKRLGFPVPVAHG